MTNDVTQAGEGTWESPPGHYMTGSFVNGQRNGVFTCEDSNGDVSQVTFENGMPIEGGYSHKYSANAFYLPSDKYLSTLTYVYIVCIYHEFLQWRLSCSISFCMLKMNL
jgi:hypothetical protein